MKKRPIVTISGSMRYKNLMLEIQQELALLGIPVIIPTLLQEDYIPDSNEMKKLLEAHFSKISISDYVLIIDKDLYLGENTKKEIIYCAENSINIRWYSQIDNFLNELKENNYIN